MHQTSSADYISPHLIIEWIECNDFIIDDITITLIVYVCMYNTSILSHCIQIGCRSYVLITVMLLTVYGWLTHYNTFSIGSMDHTRPAATSLLMRH